MRLDASLPRGLAVGISLAKSSQRKIGRDLTFLTAHCKEKDAAAVKLSFVMLRLA